MTPSDFEAALAAAALRPSREMLMALMTKCITMGPSRPPCVW
jgi:hypothetical protein